MTFDLAPPACSGSRPRAVRTLARQPHPAGIYASSYDPEVAAGICARLAAGESLRAICRADPSMPTEKTVWNWARAHPDFAAAKDMAVSWARSRARAAHSARLEAREARWWDRALSSPDGRSRVRRPSGYSPARVAPILERVRVGEPLYLVCREAEAPSLGTIYNWLRAHPEFQAAYARAKEAAFDHLVETAADAAPWLGNEARSMRALRRIEMAAHRRCARIAPRTFGNGPYGPEG